MTKKESGPILDEQSSVVYGMPREVWMRNTSQSVRSLEKSPVLLNRLTDSVDDSS